MLRLGSGKVSAAAGVPSNYLGLVTFGDLRKKGMGTDKNTVIGFVLIGMLLMGMFYFNGKSRQAYLKEQKRIEDSIARTRPVKDSLTRAKDSLAAEKIRITQSAGAFLTDSSRKEDSAVLENELLRVVFSTKGAQPRTVTLKKYNRFDGKPVVLQSGPNNQLSYLVNTAPGRTAQTADLLFEKGALEKGPDNSQTLTFRLVDSSGREMTHRYTLRPNDYRIGLDILLKGGEQLVSGNQLALQWKNELLPAEKDILYEQQQTQVAYLENGSYDFENIMSGKELKLEEPADWIAFKQQFFIRALSHKNRFQSADIVWEMPDTTAGLLARSSSVLKAPLNSAGGTASLPLELLYGPSDYDLLKGYGRQMEEIVPYGSGIFAFVKYINRHFLLPVFNFLKNNVASMGMVILLLTLFIRLLTSPILYRSYVSGAKMKALKPEIDKLKAKHGDDQQAFGIDQMKLWKSAGVNPLGGCLPALLQIPIFMSLYYFFQSNISLRGKSFLWAKDLAAYDSIYNLPFHIPFYGDHVSLFTLTATLTSLLISIYSMSSMQDNSNPVMKYMPYIFPVMLLGVFNALPSALTWYYTISNTITLILQIVIQKFIINHDKILAQIEENRKKPVKQSKLQERIQAMQEASKKMQEQRNKEGKR
jgi:YidC/Oxa1 family membrane protein insertase